MMMDENVIILVVFLLVNGGFSSKQNGALQQCTVLMKLDPSNAEDWFKIGKLHAFCIERNKSLDSIKYKECITVCKLPQPFSLTECQLKCNKSVPCKDGCRFYNKLFNATDDNEGFDSNNLPNLGNDSVISRKADHYLNTTFHWSEITSPNSFHTVYLASVTVKSKFKGKETVLALLNKSELVLLEGEVCKNKGYVGSYDPNMRFKITVYPINEHGYNRSIKLTTGYTSFKKTLGITDFKINKTGSYSNELGTVYISHDLTWSRPKDINKVPYSGSLQQTTTLVSCKNPNNYDELSFIFFPLSDTFNLAGGHGTSRAMNTDDDLLKGCTVNVQVVTKLGQCTAGGSQNATYVYEGCSSIPNYKGCTDTNIKTTKKPTQSEPSIRNITLTATGVYCCSNNSAANMATNDSNCPVTCYNLTTTWKHPITSSTIKHYLFRYGENITLENFVVDAEKTIKLHPNTTNITFTKCIKERTRLGIQLFAKTGKTDVRIFNSKGYKFITLDVLQRQNTWVTTAPITKDDLAIEVILSAVLVPLFILVTVIILMMCYLNARKSKNKALTTWNAGNFNDYLATGTLDVDDWEISPSLVEMDKKIGEGAFGTVYRATLSAQVEYNTQYFRRRSNAILLPPPSKQQGKYEEVAVKLLKEGATEEEIRDFRNEICLMKSMPYHKNVVNMMACCIHATPVFLVIEYMQHGDLLNYLRRHREKVCDNPSSDSLGYEDSYCKFNEEKIDKFDDNENITPKDLLSFAWQIASGMECISNANIVHRDLAARNILVGEDKNVKISDFGLTRKVSEDAYITTKNRRLPVKWMSVEAIFDQVFTSKSDVWSFGIVLFEITTLGGSPYPCVENVKLLNLLKNGYRMEKPHNCSEPLYDIMLQCWNENPASRPTFAQLRVKLENIMRGGDYFTFDIDTALNYYNAESFKSAPDNDAMLELFEKPIRVVDANEIDRYTRQPDSQNTSRKYSNQENFE